MIRSFKFFILLAATAATAFAEPASEYTLTIKEHRFEPASLELPARQKVKIVVKNMDSSPEEFESYDLNREKVVSGGGQITLFVGPLEPGEYRFFGEFNPETAQGKFVVR